MIAFVFPLQFLIGGATIQSFTTLILFRLLSAMIFEEGIQYIAPTLSSADTKSGELSIVLSTSLVSGISCVSADESSEISKSSLISSSSTVDSIESSEADEISSVVFTSSSGNVVSKFSSIIYHLLYFSLLRILCVFGACRLCNVT